MLAQNSAINKKLDKLQLTLEEGLAKIESNNNNNNNIDQTFVEVNVALL